MLFYNEDWMHFICSRNGLNIEVNEREIKNYIYNLKDSQITDFSMNVNGSVSTAESEIFETFSHKYLVKEENGQPVDYSDTFAKIAYQLKEQGIDLYQLWIDTARKCNIHPWISFRMNDVHGNYLPTDVRKSSTVFDHPDWTISSYRPNNDFGYFDRALDYGKDEVMNRMLRYMEEMLKRYDVDGVELDFTREVILFCPGCESQERVALYLQKIHALTEKYAIKYQHEIKLSLLLPCLPETCIGAGFPLDRLSSLGVDLVTILPRWTTVDFDMPIELWKMLLKEIPLGGGQQLLVKPQCNYPEVINSVNMAFGLATANLSRGCDFVYLYNYMDCSAGEAKFCEDIYKNSIRNDDNRRLLFENIGVLTTAAKQPRATLLTYHDYTPFWMNCESRLPLVLSKDYQQIRIPIGIHQPQDMVTLVLGFTQKISPENISVYINSTPCYYKGNTTADIYDKPCMEFSVSAQQIIFLAELASNCAATLEYAEVRVLPQK